MWVVGGWGGREGAYSSVWTLNSALETLALMRICSISGRLCIFVSACTSVWLGSRSRGRLVLNLRDSPRVTYSDEKVANRNARVRHGATEDGP
jgi:hypothetical protein